MNHYRLAYSECPYCGMQIGLFAMKDSDSFSKEEVFEHVTAHHPEKNTAHGIPFSPIFFYDLSTESAPTRKPPPEDTDEARVRRRQAARAALTDSTDGGST